MSQTPQGPDAKDVAPDASIADPRLTVTDPKGVSSPRKIVPISSVVPIL
jgi:hypothetical protein